MQRPQPKPASPFVLANERPQTLAEDSRVEGEDVSARQGPEHNPPTAAPTNEVTFDTLIIREGRSSSSSRNAASPTAYAARPGAVEGMSDFPSGLLGVSTTRLQLNLDQLTSGRQDRIIYDPRDTKQPPEEPDEDAPAAAPQGLPAGPIDSSQQAAAAAAGHAWDGSVPPVAAGSPVSIGPHPDVSANHQAGDAGDSGTHLLPSSSPYTSSSSVTQQVTPPPPGQQAPAHPTSIHPPAAQPQHEPPVQPPPPPTQQQAPRPHPFYLRPQHVKTNYKCPTADGWRLHLVRTRQLVPTVTRFHPVILCPGLGSSGAYSFDLSPAVSLADYLASNGWDVWTVELRGNGQSDKPGFFTGHSRWWTIDDHVEKDVPALIRYVLKQTNSTQVHFLGHSLGGMVLCGVMARVDTTTSRIRSCTAVGSGLFLEDSWWRLFERLMPLSGLLWTIPSGALLRWYSNLMFGPYRIPYIDNLYFWPSNVDRRVGRAMMARNFSSLSVGVVRQMVTAFGVQGLTSADGKMVYADARRLSKVRAPALFLVGDRDRMTPPEGCRRTWQMFGSPEKRFVCFGPSAGFSNHYGHFDILMGKKVDTEVFPIIQQFLSQHDTPLSRL